MKINWSKFDELVTEVAERVRSEYDVDVVVGVGRSGLIPAAIVARRLGVAEFYSVGVRFYDNGKPPKRLMEKPEIIHHNVGDLKGKRVLVVDDFSRTGATLNGVMKVLRKKGAKEVKTVVVVLREDAATKPDYYAIRFSGCVAFPWDTGHQ